MVGCTGHSENSIKGTPLGQGEVSPEWRPDIVDLELLLNHINKNTSSQDLEYSH